MPSFTSLYLGVVVPAATLIPISMGIYKYRALTPRHRALWLYLCMAAVVNAIASIFSHSNNLPLLHVYTMLELIFLVRYYLLLFTYEKIRFYLKAILILFPLYCVINFLFFQSIYTFNSYTRPVEAIILMGCSLLYFMASSRAEDEASWTSIPDNWVNAGILLYFSGALGQFAFSNVVEATTAKPVILLIWVLHATLVLIMYILFTISFSKCRL